MLAPLDLLFQSLAIICKWWDFVRANRIREKYKNGDAKGQPEGTPQDADGFSFMGQLGNKSLNWNLKGSISELDQSVPKGVSL